MTDYNSIPVSVRLTTLRDMLAGLDPAEFDISEVGRRAHCGTVACIAGHAAIRGVYGLQARWYYSKVNPGNATLKVAHETGAGDLVLAMHRAFGISTEEANDLCMRWVHLDGPERGKWMRDVKLLELDALIQRYKAREAS